MLKKYVVTPECETQAIHIIHNAQPPKHHDAKSPFYKIKHTVTIITQHIMLIHQSNIIFLRFSRCNQLRCVQLGLYNQRIIIMQWM
jgi:hypothetical protein